MTPQSRDGQRRSQHSQATTMSHRDGSQGYTTQFTLITDRVFGLWFWGNLASNSGSWIFNVTASVVVFNITGSAFLVGLLSVAQYVPLLILSPWAGALSDRLDRRSMVIAGQGFAGISAAALAVSTLMVGVDDLPGAWPVFAAAVGIGVGRAFATPAATSLVPALVNDVDLESAVSLTQMTFNVGRALGPVSAGVLLVTIGPGAAFALNAFSFLALVAALGAIPLEPPAHASQPTAALHHRTVRGGLRHLRTDRAVLLLLGGVAVAGFCADPVITLAPALSNALGEGDALVAGMASSFGVAATLGAMFSARLQRMMGSRALARTGMWAMAIGLIAAGAARTPSLALGGFAATGAGFSVASTSLAALLHRRVPEIMRGRIMALWTMAFLGNRPLAAVIDGVAADLFGPRAAMSVGATVALFGVWSVRRLDRSDLRGRSRGPFPSGSPQPPVSERPQHFCDGD